MKILFMGDDTRFSEFEMERMFIDRVMPLFEQIEEVAILNATPIELYALKWAKKLRIPYLGFLYNIEAAANYADRVFYFGNRSSEFESYFPGKIQVYKPMLYGIRA